MTHTEPDTTDDGLIVGTISDRPDRRVIYDPKTGRMYALGESNEASLREAIARGQV